MHKILAALVIGLILAGQAAAGEAARVDERRVSPSKVTTAKQKTTVKQTKPIKGDAVIGTAQKYQGVPYKFGGTTPKGFDCSGFAMFVFNEHGVKLPRTADKQFITGKSVNRKDLQSGDMVFFTTYEKGASHCGIYVGNDKFIHASSSRGVMISSLSDTYWKPRYLGARRVL